MLSFIVKILENSKLSTSLRTYLDYCDSEFSTASNSEVNVRNDKMKHI